MLRITIPVAELWDEKNQEFTYSKEQTLQLEHSLVSLSKWESEYCKPFYSKQEKTREEIIAYIRCMTLTQNVNPNVYSYLTAKNISEVTEYIKKPMTATWFSEKRKGTGRSSNITAEIIYYWMISYNIPFECQKWHLNRLMTLIQVCSEKNAPQKKRSTRQLYDRNRALNAARRNKLNTKG